MDFKSIKFENHKTHQLIVIIFAINQLLGVARFAGSENMDWFVGILNELSSVIQDELRNRGVRYY